MWRLFGQRGDGASPPPEPGLLEHARQKAGELGGTVYRSISERSPWLASRIDDAVLSLSEMERRGWTKHFGEYNETLLRPLKQGVSQVVSSATSSATCTPTNDPASAFVLWNVLCFWLAMALLLLDLLLPWGSSVAELLGGGFAYLAAYTLHFVFIRVPHKPSMLAALVLLGLYVSLNLFSGVVGLVVLLPAMMSFARAGANGILLFHAYQLFQQLDGGAGAADML